MKFNDAPFQIHKFQQIDSTNTSAKSLAATGAPHGTTVIAEEQSAGRGRLGRSFFSPAGCGIYLSMIVRPSEIGLDIGHSVLLTTAASVAVARAVSQILNKELQIKWVNDLYYNEKKVCGILAEGVVDPERGNIDSIILGIGVNFREPEGGFPTEIKDVAGALFNAEIMDNVQTPLNAAKESASVKSILTESIISHLYDLLPEVKTREFLKEYKERSLILGRQIRIFPKGFDGDHPDRAAINHDTCTVNEAACGRLAVALDITCDGGLVVRCENGSVETLTTGEISVRLL